MKILRYHLDGSEHIGMLDSAGILCLDALNFPSMNALIAQGAAALAQIDALAASSKERVALDAVSLRPPLDRPGKYLAIGMNYSKHVEESERLGVPAPTSQFWFNKQVTCISGPFDVIDPGVTDKLDYEVELGVVIGKVAKGVTAEQAHEHVFGYVVANDVSARDWQFHSPTFTIGKSFDTHGPIGPWIVTADEIPDPHQLTLRCLVNGEVRQEGHTSQMIFNVWDQIAYLSTAFTLEPGDLLATGTPEGVGIAMDPPRFLRKGDVVRCEISQIGAIQNEVSLAAGAAHAAEAA